MKKNKKFMANRQNEGRRKVQCRRELIAVINFANRKRGSYLCKKD